MSDYNLYHNPYLDMATASLFPGELVLAAWQKGNESKAMGSPATVDDTVAPMHLEPPFGFPPRDVRACCLFRRDIISYISKQYPYWLMHHESISAAS